MSWYDDAYAVMLAVWQEQSDAGRGPQDIADAIDAAYPFGDRAYYPYKAWLKARKDFCARYSLPRRTSKRLPPDLLSKLIEFTGKSADELNAIYSGDRK